MTGSTLGDASPLWHRVVYRVVYLGRSKIRVGGLVGACLALMAALLMGPARAQNVDASRLFILQQSKDHTHRAGRGEARTTPRLVQWGGPRATTRAAPAYRPPASPFDFFAALFGVAPQRRTPDADRLPPQYPVGDDGGYVDAPRGGTFAYCVRSCDGRYFPLGARVRDPGSRGAAAYCAALCPAAHMEVFTTASAASSIDNAVDNVGRSYSEIPNAFVYRSRLVDGCTCTADQVGGLQTMAITDDPTLEKGDVVMTVDGARVFAGKRQGPPFVTADFVAPDRFPGLPAQLRRRIEELEVATAR